MKSIKMGLNNLRAQYVYALAIWGIPAYLWLVDRVGLYYSNDMLMALVVMVLATVTLSPVWVPVVIAVVHMAWENGRRIRP
ncbi:hypothetical protein [Streptomyces clavifer]|uniref:hypothetical protein n=1 Tax=Streptomyces clavifer TaxID=68188 RepID=UPI003674DA3B